MRRRFILPLLAFLAAALGCAHAQSADLTVFAAASLSDAMRELGKTYESKFGGHVVFNLAGSNTLARQIKEGAPADVFFSADEAKMDDLAKADLIEPSTRRSLLSNTLVLIVNAHQPAAVKSIDDLGTPAVGKIALAQTDTVPAGIYSKKYLTSIGRWDALKKKVVECENVRAALAAVASDNVDAAFVYKTDALISKEVRVALEIPAGEGPKISYPLAVCQHAPNPTGARAFVTYLESAEGREVFAHYGFTAAQ